MEVLTSLASLPIPPRFARSSRSDPGCSRWWLAGEGGHCGSGGYGSWPGYGRIQRPSETGRGLSTSGTVLAMTRATTDCHASQVAQVELASGSRAATAVVEGWRASARTRIGYGGVVWLGEGPQSQGQVPGRHGVEVVAGCRRVEFVPPGLTGPSGRCCPCGRRDLGVAPILQT